MSFQAQTLLRLHVEAVWGVQLPAVLERDSLLLAESVRPAWKLYMAEMSDGTRYHIWRPDVAISAREGLRQRGIEALALSSDSEDSTGCSREIALQQVATPTLDRETAHSIAHQLTATEQELCKFSTLQYANRALAPLVGVVRAGHLQSLAHSSRRTTQACELGIDTLPSARRQGYALAATIVWAEMVTLEGLLPLYSAFITNHASLRLAAAAGYRAFACGATIA